MTALCEEVANDPNYRLVLDKGFIGLVDAMGDDAAIVQAARVSYGKGTRTVNEDRGLIRYLMRHHHTTPFEMCELKFRVRAPIFVVRQWFRHRTASVNEESARYSEMTDEFYFPAHEDIMPQAQDNKQGRSGEVDDRSKDGVEWMMGAAYDHSYDIYQALLGERDATKFKNGEVIYDPYDAEDGVFTDDFPGVARELARVVMPLSSYTTFYWKQNLHNLLHFLRLRADPHAQKEIRVYAEAIASLIEHRFPWAFEAWEDYVRHATHLSRMETELVRILLSTVRPPVEKLEEMIHEKGSEKAFYQSRGLTLREWKEFKAKFGLDHSS